ncbi:Uncharacterised protein [Vibrio cholerae]|nr:Uncharacterised protein [Vibrio cholerae]
MVAIVDSCSIKQLLGFHAVRAGGFAKHNIAL